MITVSPKMSDGAIVAELRRQAEPRLRALANSLRPALSAAVQQGIEATPEFSSMLSGRLRSELGLERPAQAIQSIVRAIASSAIAGYLSPKGPNDLGGISAGLYRVDFADALSADGASFMSFNSKGEPSPVPWLEWLLFEGADVILLGYSYFKSDKVAEWSRTDDSIMIKNKKPGSTLPQWGVPGEFAGGESNNWLTRAAAASLPAVEEALVDGLQRVFA